MNIKKHIPNTITCGNLLCGCLAITTAFNGNLVLSAYFVGIAAVLDFFDGFTARLLKVHSDIGKQLDSLADMVTFGVVPGVIVFKMMLISLLGMDPHLAHNAYNGIFHVSMPILRELSKYGIDTNLFILLLPVIGFIIPIFSAIRLAKFNIDTRQTNSFIGVPTPANAILICSLPLITDNQPFMMGMDLRPLLYNVYFLGGLSILMSFLLVAELPLFALKFKNFGWADNKIRYSFLLTALILLFLFKFIAIPFIIFLYIILSVVNNIQEQQAGKNNITH